MYVYYYWHLKDVEFKFELHVCDKCHNVLITGCELKNTAILNVKRVDFVGIYGILVETKLVIG